MDFNFSIFEILFQKVKTGNRWYQKSIVVVCSGNMVSLKNLDI